MSTKGITPDELISILERAKRGELGTPGDDDWTPDMEAAQELGLISTARLIGPHQRAYLTPNGDSTLAAIQNAMTPGDEKDPEEAMWLGLDGLLASLDDLENIDMDEDGWVPWEYIAGPLTLLIVAEQMGLAESGTGDLAEWYRITLLGRAWLDTQRRILGLITAEHGWNITDVGLGYIGPPREQ